VLTGSERNVTRRHRGFTSAGGILAFAVIAGSAIGVGLPGAVASAQPTLGQTVEVNPPAGSDPGTSITAIQCFSVGNCIAAGNYNNGSSNLEAMAVNEINGTWGTAVQVDNPSNAGGFPDPVIDSLQCFSLGNCVMSGAYLPSSGPQMAMYAVETNGIWGGLTEFSQLPTGADTTLDNQFQSISCPSAGNCVAVGQYGINEFTDNTIMIATETDGTWAQAVQMVLPSAFNTGDQDAIPLAISCSGSTSNCTMVGTYDDASDFRQAMADTETDGTWAQAVETTLPSDQQSGSQNAQLEGLECTSAGNCEAAGSYENIDSYQLPMVVQESDGTWNQAASVQVPSDSTTQVFAQLQGFRARLSAIAWPPVITQTVVCRTAQ